MMISCHKATELMSASRERPLTRWERLRLGFHTLVCRLCRQFGYDLENLSSLAQVLGDGESPAPTLSPEAKSKLAADLAREHGQPET